MNKEINIKDRDRIFTLKLMTEDVLDLCKVQEQYIKHLFSHFQNGIYEKTNFFKEGTLENKLYDFLDEMSFKFKEYSLPVYYFLEKIESFLIEIDNREDIKRKLKI